MDYQVFLLSRIRERFDHSGDTREAVVFGVGSTARIITGVALIIVAVFCGFAAGDLVMFQQIPPPLARLAATTDRRGIGRQPARLSDWFKTRGESLRMLSASRWLGQPTRRRRNLWRREVASVADSKMSVGRKRSCRE